jgi:hypothetical protein
MRRFFQGMLGAFLVLVAAAIIVPQWQNYLADSQTGAWLNAEIVPTVQAISANVLRLKTTSGAGVGVPKPVFQYDAPTLVKVDPNGIIFLKGGSDGQFVALIPTFSGGKVSWRCIGGSSHATLACTYWHGPN